MGPLKSGYDGKLSLSANRRLISAKATYTVALPYGAPDGADRDDAS